MADRVVIPKLGLTASTVRLVGWLVEVGGTVTSGAPLCELETEKLTVEMEAPAGGILLARLDADAGADLELGTVIGVIGSAGESVDPAIVLGAPAGPRMSAPSAPHAAPGGPDSAPTAGRKAAAPGAGAIPPLGPGLERAAASPAARTRARELGVNLGDVMGTGPGGRITIEDVEAAAGTQ